MMTRMKECTICKTVKEKEYFYRQRGYQDGIASRCIQCNKEYTKKWRLANPSSLSIQRRKAHLKRRYNLSLDEYQRLFDKQSGRCLICGSKNSTGKRRLSVDHCHETGKIRGLLCGYCNLGIGCFKNNINNLVNAIKYLEDL